MVVLVAAVNDAVDSQLCRALVLGAQFGDQLRFLFCSAGREDLSVRSCLRSDRCGGLT